MRLEGSCVRCSVGKAYRRWWAGAASFSLTTLPQTPPISSMRQAPGELSPGAALVFETGPFLCV